MKRALLSICLACGGAQPNAEQHVEEQPVAETEPHRAQAEEQPLQPEQVAEPEPPLSPMDAWLEASRLVVERPTRFVQPEGFRERAGPTVTTWTSPDRLQVVERYAHGVIVSARVEADTAPPTPVRLVPVLHRGTWPHYALLIEGADEAVAYIGERTSLRIPLRAVRGTDDETGARDSTLRVRHSCGGNEELMDGCFVYGPETSLVEHVDPAVWPGGWYLSALAPAVRGTRWTDAEPTARGSSVLLRMPLDDPDADSDHYDSARIEVTLAGRSRLLTTANVGFGLDGIYLRPSLLEIGAGVHLASLRGPERGLLFVALFDRRGRRIGRPISVQTIGDTEHGLERMPLVPVVVGPRRIGIAMLFGSGSEDALLFDPVDGRGRWVAINDDVDQTDVDALRQIQCGEVPCLEAIVPPESRSVE